MSNADPADLTGSWSGIFNYPRSLPSNAFNAVLRDSGGIIVGETSEPSGGPNSSSTTLLGWLEGRHDGNDVSFVKSYDDAKRAHYAVWYSGSVGADGTEIQGVWDIPGVWSGTFIMVRQAGKTEAVEREVAEVIR